MANWVQGDRGGLTISTDVAGAQSINVGFLPVEGAWNASSVDFHIFTAGRGYRVKGIHAAITVAGTDGSAVTVAVRKVPSGTALTSGVLLHSGTVNLKGTAGTYQGTAGTSPALVLTTTDADLNIAATDSLALDFTGVLTSAVGVITIEMEAR